MDTSYRLIWLEYKNKKQNKKTKQKTKKLKRFQALLNENLERRCATAISLSLLHSSRHHKPSAIAIGKNFYGQLRNCVSFYLIWVLLLVRFYSVFHSRFCGRFVHLFLIFGLIWFGYFAFQFPHMPSLPVPSSSLLKILFPETMSQGERLERQLFWQISLIPLVLVSYFGAKYVSIINLKHYSFKFLILDLILFFKARLVRNSSWRYV